MLRRGDPALDVEDATGRDDRRERAGVALHLDERLARLGADGANLETTDARLAVTQGLALLEERGVLQQEGTVVRVRDRFVLRYYGRQLKHLLEPKPTAPSS